MTKKKGNRFFTSTYDLSTEQKLRLQCQFERSNYMRNNTDVTTPLQLSVFDFDSTLFLSPQLSPAVWHPQFLNTYYHGNMYGPGWWSDVRSLDLGPLEEMKRTAWAGFWNEDVVEKARAAIKDSHTLTIVLTGRRYLTFHNIITEMLKAKGLDFDMVIMRDPNTATGEDYHWKDNNGRPNYEVNKSVFRSTMLFKTAFLSYVLEQLPSIRQVYVWEDREEQKRVLEQFLHAVNRNVRALSSYRVYHVSPVLPSFNPDWEKNVVSHMIRTHNQALTDILLHGQTKGKCDFKIIWNNDNTDKKEEEKEKTTTALVNLPLLRFKMQSCGQVLQLDEKDGDKLMRIAAPLIQKQANANSYGEAPQYFACRAYPVEELHAQVGETKTVTLTDYYFRRKPPCILLRAKVTKRDALIIPLWCRPSEIHSIMNAHQRYDWQDINALTRKNVTLSGVIADDLRLVVTSQRQNYKRSFSSDIDNNDLERVKRARRVD